MLILQTCIPFISVLGSEYQQNNPLERLLSSEIIPVFLNSLYGGSN